MATESSQTITDPQTAGLLFNACYAPIPRTKCKPEARMLAVLRNANYRPAPADPDHTVMENNTGGAAMAPPVPQTKNYYSSSVSVYALSNLSCTSAGTCS